MNQYYERQCRLLIATVGDLIDIIVELLTDVEHEGKAFSTELNKFIIDISRFIAQKSF